MTKMVDIEHIRYKETSAHRLFMKSFRQATEMKYLIRGRKKEEEFQIWRV